MAFPVAGILAGTAARRVISGIVVGLGNLVRSNVGQWVLLGLLWLGLSFGTHEILIQPTLDFIEDHMTANAGGDEFAVAMRAWLGVMGFDKAVSMIVSAYGIRKAAQAGKVFLKRAAT